MYFNYIKVVVVLLIRIYFQELVFWLIFAFFLVVSGFIFAVLFCCYFLFINLVLSEEKNIKLCR